MKLQDLNGYMLKLQQWREARHLSVEGQQKGLLGNLLEKLSKVARAKDSGLKYFNPLSFYWDLEEIAC